MRWRRRTTGPCPVPTDTSKTSRRTQPFEAKTSPVPGHGEARENGVSPSDHPANIEPRMGVCRRAPLSLQFERGSGSDRVDAADLFERLGLALAIGLLVGLERG